MNKKILLLGMLVPIIAALIFGYQWWLSKSAKSDSVSAVPNMANNNVSSSIPLPSSNAAAMPPLPADVSLDHQAEVDREKQVWDLLLATPIIFYGKVVDTEERPVANATASISLVDSTSDNHTKLEKITDEQGVFSISGHGLGVIIKVSKEGYFATDKSAGRFAYAKEAGPLAIHNDPSTPAIFVLKKRGQAEPLVVTKGAVKITGDGTSRSMSLTTGKTWVVPNGDITFQAWIEDQKADVVPNERYNWHCKLTIPGGGLQVRKSDDLDFTAPNDGYQPSDEINMAATAIPWSSSASRSYFVRLGNGDYARIDFSIAAENPYQIEITSYLNPTPGHRNLEYDLNQQVNQ